jgi:hypothetical protein
MVVRTDTSASSLEYCEAEYLPEESEVEQYDDPDDSILLLWLLLCNLLLLSEELLSIDDPPSWYDDEDEDDMNFCLSLLSPKKRRFTEPSEMKTQLQILELV